MVEQNARAATPKGRGQAMVEYALILALLAVAFGAAIAATGPAIGNVFCNVVHNIGGESASPQGGSCGSQPPDLSGGLPDDAHFWATVTWVAQNPQDETPFPTPVRRAPINPGGGSGSEPSDTPTLTNTPTETNTPTPTSTATETTIPTPGPSPTNADVAFTVPHVDQISKPEWWRLDLADVWTAQWYGDHSYTGTVSSSQYRTINFLDPRNTATYPGGNSLSLPWGNGRPPSDTGITSDNRFAASFSRTFMVEQDTTFEFSILADDQANIYLDGNSVPMFWSVTWNVTRKADFTIPAGMHTLRIDYAEDGGGAYIHFSMTPKSTSGSPVVAAQDNSCTWVQDNSTPANAVSISNVFDDGQVTWPSGQTCYLELRGYVDLTGHANPILSFWDLWSFASGGASGQVQISPYVTDGDGLLDRSALSWTTIATRSAGTSNFNWTRSEIDLSTLGLGNRVTLRFVVGGGGGGTPAIWNIDDIQVLDANPAPASFTVGNSWDLDSRTQMDDFIFDSDSNRTLETNPSLPNTIETWRWNLTSNNARSGTAWDDSPGYNYQGHTDGGPRVHYLEFKQPIDLTTANVPATDSEGDTGIPQLTFWMAYEVPVGSSLRVEYTRDAKDTTPDNWTALPGGILLDYTVPGALRPNEQVSRMNLAMQPFTIDLVEPNIPNLTTQPFRLRFALYINSGAATGDGWYIDDISIEREDPTPYVAYPFIDDAENNAYMNTMWMSIGGTWGQDTTVSGANGTSTAYADSVNANFSTSAAQYLQLNGVIDLLNDTAANTIEGARPPAVDPILSFWHQREVNSSSNFTVELWTESSRTWTAIWEIDKSPFELQKAWQHMEINLAAALEEISGDNWAAVQSNADELDDDIKIRFAFSNAGGTLRDGVYVDEIQVRDGLSSFRLWPAATGGSGSFQDQIEFSQPFAPSWRDRWYGGGNWGSITSASKPGYTHNGTSQALSSSPSTYTNWSFSTLEYSKIIDLTGSMNGQVPILYFWTRYGIPSGDAFQVEIAEQAPNSLDQYEGKIGGWTAWTPQPMTVGVTFTNAGITTETMHTWLRGQVDLSAFVNKKIRLRFVLSVPNSGGTTADGIYLDNIALTYRPSQLTASPAFVDSAQSTVNWITEGTWGLGYDNYIGNSANQSVFGLSQWSGTFFDCEQLKTGGESCGSPDTYTNILGRNDNFAPTAPVQTSGPRIGPENVTTVDHPYNYDRPLGGAAFGVPADYDDTYAARWIRDVTLAPGTYSFRAVSDDGFRVWIDDPTGTNLTAYSGTDSRGLIVDDWGNHASRLSFGSFTVTGGTINRTLIVEWFENSGNAFVQLYATGASYSFTDSPNTDDGDGTYTVVNSVAPGNSSLLINGFFNLSAGGARLAYQRLYTLPLDNRFYVETSIDGGFTWNTITSENATNGSYVLNSGNGFQWQQRNVALPTNANVMIRFRLDTRSAATTGDGVYLADIRVFFP